MAPASPRAPTSPGSPLPPDSVAGSCSSTKALVSTQRNSGLRVTQSRLSRPRLKQRRSRCSFDLSCRKSCSDLRDVSRFPYAPCSAPCKVKAANPSPELLNFENPKDHEPGTVVGCAWPLPPDSPTCNGCIELFGLRYRYLQDWEVGLGTLGSCKLCRGCGMGRRMSVSTVWSRLSELSTQHGLQIAPSRRNPPTLIVRHTMSTAPSRVWQFCAAPPLYEKAKKAT